MLLKVNIDERTKERKVISYGAIMVQFRVKNEVDIIGDRSSM